MQTPPPPLPMGRLARIIPADDAGEVKLAVINDEPLDRLFAAGAIDHRCYLAAQRYAETWHSAGMYPRVGGSYDVRIDAAGTGPPIERQTAEQARALQSWRRARLSVPARSRQEVDRVTLWWHEPTSRRRLIEGLDALVRYYAAR